MFDFRSRGSQVLPGVVKNLIIINVLVFFLQYVLELQHINLDDYCALHYWQSPLFRWWQMFTHMFMHGSMAHIFFNMYALWMFGRILENVWGPQRFLLFYIVCGLGAALCHLLVLHFQYASFYSAFIQYQNNPSYPAFNEFLTRHIPGAQHFSISDWSARGSIDAIQGYYSSQINQATVGASGAVFGLLFAFGYLFPNTELMMLFPPMPVKAKWFVAIYAAFELFLGIQNSAGDNVAHFAHLGGLLFAFILLRIWKSRVRDRFY